MNGSAVSSLTSSDFCLWRKVLLPVPFLHDSKVVVAMRAPSSCSVFSCLLLALFGIANGNPEAAEANVPFAYITGKVFAPETPFSAPNWQTETQVYLKGGVQRAFLREDGTFTFTNVSPGSYVVEVVDPSYTFEPVRVEINSKGKIRARKVNYIQTSQVIQVPYPLKLKPLGLTRYFQIREQWRITDFLFNPMVLMMVLPLLLVMLLPRMMNDPEARKEMEQFNNLTKYDMPEMSEVITSFFGGGSQPKPRSSKQTKKGNKNS